MDLKRTVADNAAENRYELVVDERTAFIDYLEQPGVRVLTHTEVPESLSGQGIGSALVLGSLELARDRGLRIVPLCSFVAAYIRRHPEWAEIVFEG